MPRQAVPWVVVAFTETPSAYAASSMRNGPYRIAGSRQSSVRDSSCPVASATALRVAGGSPVVGGALLGSRGQRRPRSPPSPAPHFPAPPHHFGDARLGGRRPGGSKRLRKESDSGGGCGALFVLSLTTPGDSYLGTDVATPSWWAGGCPDRPRFATEA